MLQCRPIKEEVSNSPLKLVFPSCEEYRNILVRDSPFFVRFVLLKQK